MNFILNFLKGLFIGVGAIMPGVSGGSLAVIFGLYEKITDLIANIFVDFKKNLKKNAIFFLPIGLGGIVGVLGFSKIMEYLFLNFNHEVKYLFIGLIIGTLPLVFKQANSRGFKRSYLVYFVLSFGITIFVTLLDNNAVNTISNSQPGLFMLLLCGGILGFGTIIPGISASFILIYIGVYDSVLAAISGLDVYMLIPLGIGFALSILVFAKLIDILFKKAYGYTYYTILGFVIGSVIPIFPGFGFSIKYLVCVLLLMIGFCVSFLLGRVNKNKK